MDPQGNDPAEGHGSDPGGYAAAVVAFSADAITGFSINGTVLYWNPAAERLYRLSSGQVRGRHVSDVFPPEWAGTMAHLIESAARGERLHDYEVTCRLPDRAPVQLAMSVSPITDGSGTKVGVSMAARDVTRRRRHESLLAEQFRVLEMIASGASIEETLDALAAMIERHAVSARCSILLVTGGRLRHGGGLHVPGAEDLPVEEIVSIPVGGPQATAAAVVADLASDPGWESARETVLRLGVRSCWSLAIVAPNSDRLLGVFALYYPGTYQPEDQDWSLLARLTHVAALAIDRDRTMEQLAHQAIHDPLTGAANRTLVTDRLAHAIAHLERDGGKMAVLFLDLDRFKAINDSHGHDAGDKVLIELTRRLRSVVRPSDTVARLGGDEFVVLCERITGELEAVGIADRIWEAVAAPFMVEGNEVALTASVGVAFPNKAELPDAIIERADAAMYRAKAHPKARFQLFDTDMHERAVNRLQTEDELRASLAEGQFRLLYQPLVELESDEIIAAEALIRWEHPQRGLLTPGEFLPVADSSSLLVSIDRWVLREVLRQAAEWHDAVEERARITVHVNVSGRLLRSPDFPRHVRNAVVEFGTDPSAIALEVPETVVMGDTSFATRVLAALKAIGVRLSMDDFGTGYFSLPFLRSLPIDELKVDRSFVRSIGEEGEGSVVGAVVRLAHALDVEVVAKGVERAEQVEQLRRMRCDAAQGYYWSHPLPPEELRKLL